MTLLLEPHLSSENPDSSEFGSRNFSIDQRKETVAISTGAPYSHLQSSGHTQTRPLRQTAWCWGLKRNQIMRYITIPLSVSTASRDNPAWIKW